MKIVSWNINGLRAGLRKGIWGPLMQVQPDVICFQETRVKPEQLSQGQHAHWENFYQTWNPAERPGYSGVLTLSKQAPEAVENGLGLAKFDQEGRIVRSQFSGVNLFNIYFPNGKRDLSRVPYKLEFYKILLDLVDMFHARGELVILCGDFNTAHQAIDLKNHKSNEKSTGFLPEERAWIDRYLDHGLVDIYRKNFPDREQYTWWTFHSGARARNVGWRLDYFLISEGLVGRVVNTEILDQIMGSDHCPVALELNLN